MKHLLTPLALLLLATPLALGAETPAQGGDGEAAARAKLTHAITLRPQDVRSIPDAPAGFDQPGADVESGRIEVFSYHSAVTGTERLANVYLPPNYSPEHKYPVLYLLHGIGGNRDEWRGMMHPEVILDKLLAEGKAVPMVIVMPNGRAMKDDSATGNIFAPEKVEAFARFEEDLFGSLIPAVEAHYSVATDRAHRALAGLSMGGGQTLNFGLAHPDQFAAIGAFSPAPNTREAATLIPEPKAFSAAPMLIYLSCGNRDGLMNISQNTEAYLTENHIPHLWNVDDHAHDAPEWANNFHHFVQLIFKETK